MASRVSEIAAQRRILVLLVRRDLRLRYARSALGYVWTMLDPLLMALVYAFIFVVLIGARNIGEQPYILYLLVGMLGWNWFAAALTEGCRSLSGEAKMVRTANVPREVWVARTVLSKMLEFILALPIVVGFAIFYRHGINWHIIFFPVGMLIQFVLGFGFALMLAPLTVLAEDVQRIVRILLRIGFYLTPVIYSLNSVAPDKSWIKTVAELNPMAGVLSLYRIGFWEQDALGWKVYLFAAVSSVVILVLGLTVFRRLEGTVLKEI